MSAALWPITALLEPDGSEAAGDGEDAGRGPGQSALLLFIIDLFHMCKASKAQKVVTDVFFPIKKEKSLLKDPGIPITLVNSWVPTPLSKTRPQSLVLGFQC